MALPTVVSPIAMQQPVPKFKGTAAASTAAPTCTHTFDAWRNFAVSYAAQRNISGKYGVDFRFAPEPTGGDRRTLKLLDAAARCLGPNMLKRSAVQFDFIENTNARVQLNHPCAQPSAHVAPSTSSQPLPSRIQTHAQPQIQHTISTSSSATPRASPEQERPQVRLLQHNGQQQHQDPLHDIFFNFDLASPSEASAPPDTDGEQEHDTEGTDTESERELRLSDLEGPVALRRRTVRGRGRGARRVRAGSISTNSTSSGPGMSPVSPTAVRSGGNVQARFSSSANPNVPASALRTVYARHSSALSPIQDQGLNQAPPRSQPVSGVSPHFPTSISESGVGIVGTGTGVSPNGAGMGSIGLSAAARARIRGRGIGASKSEPDPEVTPTNTAGTSNGPGSGAMQMRGDYSVGPYGYRYPVHPPYPGSALGASASQMQVHAQEYAPPPGLGTVKEETPNSILNWQASTSAVGMGTSMEIDLDLGGWGKMSEPLPGMDLSFGMHYTSPYVNQSQTHAQSQNQGSGTYQNQAYSQQQSPYSPQQHQQNGMTGTFGAQMPYYTSPTLTTHAPTGTTANMGMTVNPSLNMSPSKWKGANSSSGSGSGSGSPSTRQNRALSLSHVQGHDQRTSFWSSRNGL